MSHPQIPASPTQTVACLPEDLLAYAISYLEMAAQHHDSLAARIREQSTAKHETETDVVGRLQRQLHVQAAVVEAAMQIVDEMVACDKVRGQAAAPVKADARQLRLLDEIRGLADMSVPA